MLSLVGGSFAIVYRLRSTFERDTHNGLSVKDQFIEWLLTLRRYYFTCVSIRRYTNSADCANKRSEQYYAYVFNTV